MKRILSCVLLAVAAGCQGGRMAKSDSAHVTDSAGRQVPTGPFVARGSEPGWILRMARDSVTYIGSYGEDTVSAPVTGMQTSGATTTYETPPAFKLTVTVRPETCGDASTGMPHPYVVSVTHDSLTVNGCGGEPVSLLTAAGWVVTEVAGTAMTGTRPTLSFEQSGRVAGTTSCNQYTAPFTLTGEGLRFGPAVSTKRACQAPLMDQELLFLRILAGVSRFEIGSDGTLRLLTDRGEAIVARRQ